MMNIPVNSPSLLLLLRFLPLLFTPNFSEATSLYKHLSPRSVRTKYGSLRGIVITLSDTFKDAGQGSSVTSLGPVEAFLGVPFATPPVGQLRFMPPVTPAHWRGTRVVSVYGSVCPQTPPDPGFSDFFTGNDTKGFEASQERLDLIRRISPFLQNQSEDCLNLNIFAPFSGEHNLTRRKLPLLVFVHGESYFWGSGNSYDGSILASYGDLMVITLNYRLGSFGFLPTTVDGATRGNYGLMDVIAALHWVQANIVEIGGDPHNLTLVGHGRGAEFVNLLMISPMARGLFARAVLMSGSALHPLTLAKDPEGYSRYLAKSVNCPHNDVTVMVECLRTKSVEELLKVETNRKWEAFESPIGPIIDGLVIPQDPRLVVYQNQGIVNRQSEQLNEHIIPIPLLYGVTRVESAFLLGDIEQRHGIDLIRRDAILRNLVRHLVDYYQEVVLLTLINEYTDWSVPTEHPINVFDSLLDMLSDALVVAPLTNFAQWYHRQLRRKGQPIGYNSSGLWEPSLFSYLFVYQSEKSGTTRLGCVHGDELPYLFGAPIAANIMGKPWGHFPLNFTRPEVGFSEVMMNYWANFAKYGNPNGLKGGGGGGGGERGSGSEPNLRGEGVEGVEWWPRYDPLHQKYLMIGMKAKAREGYHIHRLSYWNHLIPRLQLHGKRESEHLIRYLQDQDKDQGKGDITLFNKISLQFFSPFKSQTTKSTSIEQSEKALKTTPGSSTPLTISSSDIESTIVSPTVQTPGNKLEHDRVDLGLYSATMGLNIAVGFSMLLLNLSIFVLIFLYLRKEKRANQLIAKQYIEASRSGCHCQARSASLWTFNSLPPDSEIRGAGETRGCLPSSSDNSEGTFPPPPDAFLPPQPLVPHPQPHPQPQPLHPQPHTHTHPQTNQKMVSYCYHCELQPLHVNATKDADHFDDHL